MGRVAFLAAVCVCTLLGGAGRTWAEERQSGFGQLYEIDTNVPNDINGVRLYNEECAPAPPGQRAKPVLGCLSVPLGASAGAPGGRHNQGSRWYRSLQVTEERRENPSGYLSRTSAGTDRAWLPDSDLPSGEQT